MTTLANLVVHVGLAQSGSTTLQKHIFNRTDFGFALLTPYEQRRETVRQYIELPLPGEFAAGSCRDFFQARFAAYGDDRLVPVISNEGLSGQNFLRMDRNPETELFARRILEAFGRVKIVLVLREQNALLLSKYRKLLERFEGNVSLRQFVRRKPHRQRVQLDCDSVFLGLFEFDKLVAMYASFFGPENVLALPLEMMERDSAQFLTRLNAFCGSHVPPDLPMPRTNVNGNAATSRFYRLYNFMYSPNSVSLLWFLNPRISRGRARMRKTPAGRASRWLQSTLVGVGRRFLAVDEAIAKERQRQKDLLKGLVGDFFVASNDRLSKMIGLDLAQFGYATSRTDPGAVQSSRESAAAAGSRARDASVT